MEGNQMKIREALEQASYFLRRHHMGAVYAPDGETLIFCEDVAKIVDEALSSPPRNCDVGTAEEQKERFEGFCDDEKGDRQHCLNCRLCNALDCELEWAQMPYEAERKGDGDGR